HRSRQTGPPREPRPSPGAAVREAIPCRDRQDPSTPFRSHFRSYRYLRLTISYHATVITLNGTSFACAPWSGCNDAAEKDMKIYLLMLLIGTILTAIRFTSAPK